mmetsp:Transcript_14301/g.23120  ORF Transcript_14301/g.23120 Transcript_14301/m.23120 type:complete len:267 (+) Transcript_14301:284-1084(+)
MNLVFLIRHVIAEDFLPLGVSHSGKRISSSTTIGLNTNFIASLGLNREFDLVKVSVLLTRRSLQGLHGRKFLVGNDFCNVVHGDIIETDKKRKFVDGHVLQHTLRITFKAFSKRLRCVFVGIVGHKGDMGSRQRFGKFTSLAHVLADVLVVSHQNFNTSGSSFVLHGFQFGNCGGSRLFQIDALGAVGDGFTQQAWIVSGTPRDQGQPGCLGRWQIVEGSSELGSVLGLGLILPCLEVLSGRRVPSGAHEPRFDNEIQRGTWAFVL